MMIMLESNCISKSHPLYVIAEIGVNHNGSPELAEKLLQAASMAGANAVKFQLFSKSRLVTPGRQGAILKAPAGLELTPRQLQLLKGSCARLGVTFLCTPFDLESAAQLHQMNVPAFKVGSGDITFTALLEQVAAYGKPVLLSTGMSGLADIERALETLGDIPTVLLHCTSAYPAPFSELNLRVISTLKAAFKRIVGYSDHSPGLEAPLAAAALGYKVIEKHITLDRRMKGPDHHSSLEPDEFKRMVEGIRRVEEALGSTVKMMGTAEEKLRPVARRSIYPKKYLAANHHLAPEDLVCLRPEAGLEAHHYHEVTGRRLRRSINKGQALEWSDLV